VPVADGGGECGLDNYRLLCRQCHVKVTGEWRKTREAIRQLSKTSVQPPGSSNQRSQPPGIGREPIAQQLSENL